MEKEDGKEKIKKGRKEWLERRERGRGKSEREREERREENARKEQMKNEG